MSWLFRLLLLFVTTLNAWTWAVYIRNGLSLSVVLLRIHFESERARLCRSFCWSIMRVVCWIFPQYTGTASINIGSVECSGGALWMLVIVGRASIYRIYFTLWSTTTWVFSHFIAFTYRLPPHFIFIFNLNFSRFLNWIKGSLHLELIQLHTLKRESSRSKPHGVSCCRRIR